MQDDSKDWQDGEEFVFSSVKCMYCCEKRVGGVLGQALNIAIMRLVSLGEAMNRACRYLGQISRSMQDH